MTDRRTYKGHQIIDGLKYSTVRSRVMRHGWDIEKACTTPPLDHSVAARRADTYWRRQAIWQFGAKMGERS